MTRGQANDFLPAYPPRVEAIRDSGRAGTPGPRDQRPLPQFPNAPAELLALHALARAELTRISGPPDPSIWAAAAAAWDEFGCPYQRAYALWREAEALLDSRSRRAAQRRLVTAAEMPPTLTHDPYTGKSGRSQPGPDWISRRNPSRRAQRCHTG